MHQLRREVHRLAAIMRTRLALRMKRAKIWRIGYQGHLTREPEAQQRAI